MSRKATSKFFIPWMTPIWNASTWSFRWGQLVWTIFWTAANNCDLEQQAEFFTRVILGTTRWWDFWNYSRSHHPRWFVPYMCDHSLEILPPLLAFWQKLFAILLEAYLLLQFLLFWWLNCSDLCVFFLTNKVYVWTKTYCLAFFVSKSKHNFSDVFLSSLYFSHYCIQLTFCNLLGFNFLRTEEALFSALFVCISSERKKDKFKKKISLITYASLRDVYVLFLPMGTIPMGSNRGHSLFLLTGITPPRLKRTSWCNVPSDSLRNLNFYFTI